MVGKITNLHKQSFKRGEEKGYFEFGGSTVVLFIKKDVVEIDEDILSHSKNEMKYVFSWENVSVH